MKNHEIYASQIAKKYQQLSPFLNEKAKRLWCASEASMIGYGGASIVKQATNISRPTITKVLKNYQYQLLQ